MADQDYPDLYAKLESSAERAADAAVSFEGILGGTESQQIPVRGFGNQPTVAKRVADKVVSETTPKMNELDQRVATRLNQADARIAQNLADSDEHIENRLGEAEARLQDDLSKTIRQDDGKKAVLTVMDEYGYAQFVSREDGSFGTAMARMDRNSVSNNAFTIGPSTDGASFAVCDPHGFYSVYVKEGESLEDTSRVRKELEAAQRSLEALGTGAAIPVPRVKIIAHRGTAVSGVAPENSLDAYVFSARAGYEIVETDVLKTSDSQYVIMHDDTINRTCRNASDYSAIASPVSVIGTSLADLRANYVLAADNPKHRRKIPTLAEFLSTCRAMGLHPIIELKNTSFSQADVAAIVNMAAEYLGANGFSVTSFNLSLLDYVRTLYDEVTLYYIYSTLNQAAIDHMVEMQPACLNSEQGLYTQAIIAEAHRKGVTCAAWTVGTGNFNRLVKLGLDRFASNTIAPEISKQSFIYRNFSDVDFAAYDTSGNVANGVINLLPGQTVTFIGQAGKTVPFGAFYLSFDFMGAGTLVATRVSGSLDNQGDDYSTYSAQAILVNDMLTYTITAGTGGCRVKDIHVAIANL